MARLLTDALAAELTGEFEAFDESVRIQRQFYALTAEGSQGLRQITSVAFTAYGPVAGDR